MPRAAQLRKWTSYVRRLVSNMPAIERLLLTLFLIAFAVWFINNERNKWRRK